MAYCNDQCDGSSCGGACARQDAHGGSHRCTICDWSRRYAQARTSTKPAAQVQSSKLNRARRKITKLRKLLGRVERIHQRWNGCPECPFCGELFAGRGDVHSDECEVFTKDGALKV